MAWLADISLIAHFAFVLFVIGGLAAIWLVPPRRQDHRHGEFD